MSPDPTDILKLDASGSTFAKSEGTALVFESVFTNETPRLKSSCDGTYLISIVPNV